MLQLQNDDYGREVFLDEDEHTRTVSVFANGQEMLSITLPLSSNVERFFEIIHSMPPIIWPSEPD